MSAEDLERYETEVELQLYQEYRTIAENYRYIVETERRFYLANHVDVRPQAGANGEVYFDVTLREAWVWDMYRRDRQLASVRVVTFKDVNVEEIDPDVETPDSD